MSFLTIDNLPYDLLLLLALILREVIFYRERRCCVLHSCNCNVTPQGGAVASDRELDTSRVRVRDVIQDDYYTVYHALPLLTSLC